MALGSTRVKELVEVLNRKRLNEIEDLKKTLPTEDELEKQIERDFGVVELRRKLKETITQAEYISKQIENRTGETISIRVNRSTYDSKAEKVLQKLKQGQKDKIEEINRRYDEKVAKLWLAKDLEEARQIVNGD